MTPAEFNRALEGRPERRPYSNLATKRQRQDIRDLALRLGVEPPTPISIMWAKQARDATRGLLANLAHRRQPSLFEDAKAPVRSEAA